MYDTPRLADGEPGDKQGTERIAAPLGVVSGATPTT